ncbi:MAG: hypothetical protein K6F73_04420 [Lachnospiraceae bacterium]|nr:hypothetical protein [Lachnospiraceae bacterium]
MKKRIAVILSLIAVTALLAFIYLFSRASVKPGDLLIRCAGKEITVTYADLDKSHVSGTVKNKKGEVKTIDTEGFPVSSIPALANIGDFSEISVYSDDEYSASLTSEEALSDGKAYLIDDDGKIRLIVFGDEDSKRDVKNVVRIEIK